MSGAVTARNVGHYLGGRGDSPCIQFVCYKSNEHSFLHTYTLVELVIYVISFSLDFGEKFKHFRRQVQTLSTTVTWPDREVLRSAPGVGNRTGTRPERNRPAAEPHGGRGDRRRRSARRRGKYTLDTERDRHREPVGPTSRYRFSNELSPPPPPSRCELYQPPRTGRSVVFGRTPAMEESALHSRFFH